MPSRSLPASIRYLKARLTVLKRPSVWGSASLLLVALFVLSEYWSQPDRFIDVGGDRGDNRLAPEATPPSPQLSPLDPFSSVDDPAPASADRSSDRVEQLTEPFAEQENNPLTAQDELDVLNTLLLNPLAVPSLAVASPSRNSSSFTPILPSTPPDDRSLLNQASMDAGRTSGVRRSFNESASPQRAHSSSENPSPIQSALDRQAGLERSTSESSDPALSPTSGAAPTPDIGDPNPISTPLNLPRPYVLQPLPGQPSLGQTFPQPVYVPQTSPAPGTTGYTLPPAFRSPVPEAAQQTIDLSGNAVTPGTSPISSPSRSGIQPPSIALPTTVQPERFGTAQPQFVQPQPAPFSIPRSAPGSTIGGGQINTFSNP